MRQTNRDSSALSVIGLVPQKHVPMFSRFNNKQYNPIWHFELLAILVFTAILAPLNSWGQSATKVYWINENGTAIERANLDGSEAEEVVSGLTQAVRLAIDPVGRTIFWCHQGAGIFKIESLDLDGNGDREPFPLVSPSCPSSSDIVIHNKKMYFFGGDNQPGLPAFSRANLDGTDEELIIFGDISTMYGVAGEFFFYSSDLGVTRIHLPSGDRDAILPRFSTVGHIVDDSLSGQMVFHTDFNINWANYDGSGIQEVVFSDNIQNLVYDPSSGRLVWVEDGIIRSSSIDGSDVITLGKKNPSDIAIFTEDVSGPEITHALSTPLSAQEAEAVSIDASITDDISGVASVLLFYRRGGDPDFQQVAMQNTADDTYSATIPASSITTRGAEYYIHAVDEEGNVSQLPTEEAAEAVLPISVRIASPGLESTIRQSTQQSGYRLISVPMVLENNASSSILSDLGPYDDTQWRLWELRSNYFDFEGVAQYNELANRYLTF